MIKTLPRKFDLAWDYSSTIYFLRKLDSEFSSAEIGNAIAFFDPFFGGPSDFSMEMRNQFGLEGEDEKESFISVSHSYRPYYDDNIYGDLGNRSLNFTWVTGSDHSLSISLEHKEYKDRNAHHCTIELGDDASSFFYPYIIQLINQFKAVDYIRRVNGFFIHHNPTHELFNELEGTDKDYLVCHPYFDRSGFIFGTDDLEEAVAWCEKENAYSWREKLENRELKFRDIE